MNEYILLLHYISNTRMKNFDIFGPGIDSSGTRRKCMADIVLILDGNSEHAAHA